MLRWRWWWGIVLHAQALSMFEQERTVSVFKLEHEFHHMRHADGTCVTEVVYNRGL